MVLLQKIVDKKITQSVVAEQLNLSERHIRTLVAQYKENGPEIFACKKNRQSNRSLDVGLKLKALEIIKQQYFDFGPTFIAEKLSELDAININKETIRKWLIEEGLWKGKRGKEPKIQQRNLRNKESQARAIPSRRHNRLPHRPQLSLIDGYWPFCRYYSQMICNLVRCYSSLRYLYTVRSLCLVPEYN